MATQEEKRILILNTLEQYAEGDHKLSVKVGKLVPLEIEEASKLPLVDRIMKIPKAKYVKFFLDSIVTDPLITDFLTKDEEKIRRKTKRVDIKVYFRHFECPVKDGGWSKPNLENPLFRAWQRFFGQYQEQILQGRNQLNLKIAHDNDYPIDFVYSTYKGRLLRFLLVDPYPETQIGCQTFVAIEEPKKAKPQQAVSQKKKEMK